MKKSLLISVAICGLFAFTNANAVGVSVDKSNLSVSTIDLTKDSARALSTPTTPIALVDTKPSGGVSVVIDGMIYYFVASGDNASLIEAISYTPAQNLVEVASGGMFSVNGKEYNFDVEAIPDSKFSLRELSGSDSTNFDITKYLLESDGSFTSVKYALEFENFGDAAGTLPLYYKWGFDADGNRTIVATDVETDADITFMMKDTYGDTLAAGDPNPVTKYYNWSIDANGIRTLIEVNDPTEIANGNYEIVASSSDNTAIKTDQGGTDINRSFIGFSVGGIYNNGGGIALTSGSVGDVTGDFVANKITQNGGGIYLAGGSVGNVVGDFIGNKSKNGGGIYLQNVSSIGDITGDFIGNSVTGSGGAIYLSDSDVTAGSITGNFIDNYASFRGGAISTGPYSSALFGDITGVFIGNHSKNQGGALNLVITTVSRNVYGTFIGNYLINQSQALGGAIWSSGSTSSLNITADFINNYAIGSYAIGGAYYAAGYSNEYGIVGDFIGNYAIGTSSYARAGALFGAYAYTVDGDFINNYVIATLGNAEGGAAYNIGRVNGDFIDNYAKGLNAYGGAVSFLREEMNSDFVGNYAEGAELALGGAVYNNNNKDDSAVINGDFINNYASGGTKGYGGAIYSRAAVASGWINSYVKAVGSLFENNWATTAGGAIYNTNLYVDETDPAITNNNNQAFLYIETADDGTRSSFVGNHATEQGGAIYNGASLGTINIDADFSGNYVGGPSTGSEGGAIYNATVGAISLISGSFVDNYASGSTADKGGAIYNAGTIALIENSSFANDAVNADADVYTDFGGAIYNSGTITKISNTTFDANMADKQGGAIWNSGTVNTVDTSFTNNKIVSQIASSSNTGGAIYNTGTFSLFAETKDVSISGNSINGVDNGIYNSGTLSLSTKDDNTITLGDAITGSGGVINASGNIIFNANVSGNDINVSTGNLIFGTTSSTVNANGYYTGVSFDNFYLSDTTKASSINLIDGLTSEYYFEDLTIDGGKFSVDMDFTTNKSDIFIIDGTTDVNSSMLSVNIIDVSAAVPSGEIEVFRANGTITDLSLIDQDVDIISRDEHLSLVHNNSKLGWYNYVADFSDVFNLDIAIDQVESDNTIYKMSDLYPNETVTTKEVESTDGSGKIMTVDGSDGANGFVVKSGNADGSDALLTLISGSEFNSINVGYEGVNFDMSANNNSMAFLMDGSVTEIDVDSDISSGNQSNTVSFEGGTYNLSGNYDNLTLESSATINASGIISNSIIDSTSTLNRTNFDYGNTIMLNATGSVNYSDWDYLYSAANHNTTDKLNSLDFNGGGLDLLDSSIQDLIFDGVEISADSSLSLDVDLEGDGSSDKITANSLTNASDNTIEIDAVNIIGDATKDIGTDPMFVTFAGGDLLNNTVFSLSDTIATTSATGVIGNYLIGDEKIEDGQLSFRYANLFTATNLDITTKSYTMTENDIVDKDIGTLAGKTLSINGGGFDIYGAGNEGMNIATGQILNINNVGVIEGFSGDFVTASGGTINITGAAAGSTFESSISGEADISVTGDVTFDTTSLEGEDITISSGSELTIDDSTATGNFAGEGVINTSGDAVFEDSTIANAVNIADTTATFIDTTVDGSITGNGTESIITAGNSVFNGDVTISELTNTGELTISSALTTGVITNDGAIFNAGADLTLTEEFNGGEFNLLEGFTLTLDGTNAIMTTDVFNAKEGAKINVTNGEENTINLGASTFDDTGLSIDVSLNNGRLTGDTFIGESDGTTFIDAINVLDTPSGNISGATGTLDIFTNANSSVFIEGGEYGIITNTYTLMFYSGTNSLSYILNIENNSLEKVIASIASPRKYIMSMDEGAGDEVLVGDMTIEGNGFNVNSGTITMDATNSSLTLDNVNMGASIIGNGKDITISGNGFYDYSGTIDDANIILSANIERTNQDTNVNYTVSGKTLAYSDEAYLAGPNSYTFNGGALDIANDQVGNAVIENLTINSSMTMGVDVDLAKEEMDTLEVTNLTVNGNSGILVNHLNLLSDSLEGGTTYTDFTTDMTLAGYVDYVGADQVEKAIAPVYIYDVLYDALTGKFSFTRAEENPETQAPGLGSLTTITMSDEIYSKVLATNSLVFDTPRAKGLPSGDDLYDRSLKNAWMKAFGSDENLDVKNAPSVDAYFTGLIAGFDTGLLYEGDCMYANYGLYAAYTNGYMRFDGNKFYQNGYFVGANANFYNNEWFFGAAASVGMVRNKDKFETSAKFNSYMAGIGLKAGYDYNLGNGFSLTPSIYASYVYSNSNKYVSARGAEVDFDGSHNFSISPELKLKKDISKDHSAYIKTKYVHNFNEGQNIVADGFVLNEVSLRPHVEYGVGFEKTTGEWTGYAEVMRKDFGSEGFEVMLGVKYHFD